MLFRSLNPFISTTIPGRIIPKLNNYIDTLSTKIQLISDRYTPMQGNESNGVRLLKKIISVSSIDELLTYNSDYDRYMYVLQYTSSDLDNIFDTNATGNIYKDMFIKTSGSLCEEAILPVRCDSPTTTLPFNQGWDKWKLVRAVHIVDVDSMELSLETYMDQVVYRTDIPSRAVITIDTTALVLQYVNYLNSNDTDKNISIQVYIHQCVLPGILEDLGNLWLRNIYSSYICKVVPDIITTGIIAGSTYSWAGNSYPQAMESLSTYIDSCQSGNITPIALLSSLRMLGTYDTVPKYLANILDTTTVEDLRQYKWAEYLKDIGWLDLIQFVYGLNPNFVSSRNLRNVLSRDIPFISDDIAARIKNI